MKAIIKDLLKKTPYRVIRDTAVNRFQGIDQCIENLRIMGFGPRIVIDGGAHLGDFSLVAKNFFPEASFHLIEPQPACAGALRALCKTRGWFLHETALGTGAEANVDLVCAEVPNTGAYIRVEKHLSTAAAVSVPSLSLDQIFGDTLRPDDRVFLKMDIQGYELHALRGATRTLESVEVILTEVSFFIQAYEPSILELMVFLDNAGFALYDIASVSARQRDNRARQGDFVFIRKGSNLIADTQWA